MKLWMKKFTVLLITILTLGLYVPPISIDADVDKEEIKPAETDAKPVAESAYDIEKPALEETSDIQETNSLYLQELNQAAKEQVLTKIGTKMVRKIDSELDKEILPNLELVLDSLYEEIGLENSQYLMIEDTPALGYGERIFNLYDAKMKQDIAKFHVNRIKKPQDGYYFQFHYHLKSDQFENHYPFGEIYWGKDTPPKWMS